MAEKANVQGLKAKLHDLPAVAGVGIMAVLLVISLFAGNFRALQRATPKDFIRQGDVKSIIEDRIDAAQNVVSVAGVWGSMARRRSMMRLMRWKRRRVRGKSAARISN